MSDELHFDLTLYPEPILRKRAEPISAFDSALKRTVVAMYERMFESKGVGLAAPQVGLKQRILVVNPTGDRKDDLTLVNPTISAKAGDDTLFEEGCLSFPGIYAEIKRPERCTVVAFDVDGNRIEKEFDGFVARIIQHEFDHLEGVLLVDRMSPTDKLKNRGALEELVERYQRRLRKSAAQG
ncbi:MAG: peptide deformylase [Planctomycetota bacterium]|nr:peptide deformylase [Planctomycetota bacterium]